jgi:hypothetical protein
MIAGIARAVLAVLGASCLASARADDLDVGTVLANVRAAVGYQRLASLPGSVLVTGSAMIAGESGDYRCSFTPAGSYREQNGGLIAASRGFDGQVCWEVDPTGMPRTMILEDREKNLIWMWIRTHRWLAADAPFRIALVPDATDASTVTLTLALDEATLEERLVIDRATWLPSSSTHECDGVKEQLTLADYVETLGFKLARTLVLEQRLRREYRLRSVIVSAVVPSESYALPAERPHDTRIDPEAKPELELMRARSGHLLVKPVVNGEERGWFLLDTGAAALVIDDKVADAAGMTAFGRASAVGVGGAVGARFRRGRSLRLGPLTMDDPMYGGIDLESLSTAIGTPIVGICGYDLFSRAVVEIDMERLRVSLFDRGKYELTRGNWQELEIVGRHPCVRCTFAGGEGPLPPRHRRRARHRHVQRAGGGAHAPARGTRDATGGTARGRRHAAGADRHPRLVRDRRLSFPAAARQLRDREAGRVRRQLPLRQHRRRVPGAVPPRAGLWTQPHRAGAARERAPVMAEALG